MGLQKHHRLALRAVRCLSSGMEVRLLPGRKHPKLVACFAGHTVRVTVSGSPACDEDVVWHCVRDVRARFRALGVGLGGPVA